LSWLNDLGALPETEPSKPDPAKPGEDLSWLNAFGETPQSSRPASTPPAAQQDDLSWLDDLGSLPPADQPAPEPGQSKEDLSWLNAFSEAPPLQNQPPAPSQDDLGWLKELDDVTQSLQPGEQKQEPPASGEDLSWLRDLQGRQGTFSSALNDPSLEQIPSGESTEPQDLPKVPPFTPRHTAPLGEETEPSMPDWLKSATEEPSLPLGPQAFDQIRDDKKVPDISAGLAAASIFGAADRKAEEPATPSQPEAGETSPLFSQDVDSIFSQDMPDWLTRTDEPAASQPEEEIGIHAEGGEALSPADLPSWVQAMRPVGAVIGDVAPRPEDLPLEREGPLAGLKGVLPLAAIGSLRRPRPIPLTLQASTEQQASAAIFEEILLGETTPRPVVSTPEMASQRTLRWVIAGLIIFILSAMIFSGTQIMPVSPVLPPAAGNIPNVVLSIAENAPVLVVVDYQPALAGEMEAVSGPLLDQLVQLRHPYLAFLATSPSGNVLVERLLRNTNISQPDGSGYVAGQNYTNMGYLPGGESGVLAFLQSPQTAIPSSPVLEFSEYAAILLLTDHAESARVWVEQLDTMKQSDPALASQPLLAVSSAQAGPMLQPYFDSGQVTGLINGLPIAARYESLNLNRPGIARSYWDAFGVGMMMAVILIVLGSLWSIYSGVRARSAEAAKE
jgi:hypothetical protein